MQHEDIGDVGSVSWMHIKNGKYSETVNIPDIDYDNIFTITRDPIKVISSAQTLAAKSFLFMYKNVNNIPNDFNLWSILKKVMFMYVEWNKIILNESKYFFKIENIRKEFPVILGKMNIELNDIKYINNIEINTRKEKYNLLCYNDLRNVDIDIYNSIMELKNKFEY